MDDIKYWCECINLLKGVGEIVDTDSRFFDDITDSIASINSNIIQPMIQKEIERNTEKQKRITEKVYMFPGLKEENEKLHNFVDELQKKLECRKEENTALVKDYSELQQRYNNLIDNNS